jgi:hypothetical protein
MTRDDRENHRAYTRHGPFERAHIMQNRASASSSSDADHPLRRLSAGAVVGQASVAVRLRRTFR